MLNVDFRPCVSSCVFICCGWCFRTVTSFYLKQLFGTFISSEWACRASCWPLVVTCSGYSLWGYFRKTGWKTPLMSPMVLGAREGWCRLSLSSMACCALGGATTHSAAHELGGFQETTGGAFLWQHIGCCLVLTTILSIFCVHSGGCRTFWAQMLLLNGQQCFIPPFFSHQSYSDECDGSVILMWCTCTHFVNVLYVFINNILKDTVLSACRYVPVSMIMLGGI